MSSRRAFRRRSGTAHKMLAVDQSLLGRRSPNRGHGLVAGGRSYHGLRGLGFFGSGAACQFTPSIVLRMAFAARGDGMSSPSQFDHASSSRKAGMRGSSSRGLMVRRMSWFAGTVTMTHASIGTGSSGMVNLFQTKAKPRGRPSRGSTVH